MCKFSNKITCSHKQKTNRLENLQLVFLGEILFKQAFAFRNSCQLKYANESFTQTRINAS